MNQFYGIFRQYSFKQININNKKFKEFLVKSYDIAINSIDKLAENIGTDRSAILPKEIMSFILNLLTTVPIHDRSTKLYSHFALIHQPLRDNMQIKWSDFKPKIDFIKRVQEPYMASKKGSNNNKNQTCVNIEIKEFFEFGYEMNADDLLPIWTQEQENIVPSIITDTDQIEQPIKYVAGLDISFVKTNDKAVGSMVIFDYDTLNIVAKISVNCNMKIPYIPSYLAFREAPVFMKLIDIQKECCPHLTPQVILMDGNGVWHPRRAGIASHFGVLSGFPCFGVSKNVLYADGITREKIEELLTEKASGENQYVEVIGDSGNVLGLAYNVTGFVKNAVYISVGHKITLTTACDIFKSVTKYRNCEPIRQADLLSREMVTKIS
ncbi:unnamed protein product [Rotaria sordida]|uniref:Endonuclease V n=1 Tax=Rotaria sordida TaxID=392033 RepID=A0A814L850_9BILA|nr:unnamed protein product [Rotaria sordida]CAF3934081.1 unnamed protein product [Rotaria sordida]